MKSAFLILTALGLLLTGCTGTVSVSTATPGVLPTAVADVTIIAEGRLEPAHYAEIAFSASGRIREVGAWEGQEVREGAEIIQLGDASDVQYAAAQLELVSARKALNDLVDASGTEFARAIIDLKDAEEEYEKAENYLQYLRTADKIPQTRVNTYLVQTRRGYEYRTRTRHFKGPAPQDWIVEAENDLALEKAERAAAQRTYDRLKDGADSEQLAVLQARLDAAEAGLAAFSIVAPFDGVIAHINARPGGTIQAGQTAVVVADFSEWLVKTTDLTEIDVVQLEVGQPVTVMLDAIPGVALAGEILSIGLIFSENQGDIVYDVTVLLKERHPGMRWGMTAAVEFE